MLTSMIFIPFFRVFIAYFEQVFILWKLLTLSKFTSETLRNFLSPKIIPLFSAERCSMSIEKMT